jgi:hypothetical protein
MRLILAEHIPWFSSGGRINNSMTTPMKCFE